MRTENQEIINKPLRVGDAVEFISREENVKSLKKTYIYSVNQTSEFQYIIQHPQGIQFDETLKKELTEGGYDVSKLRTEHKYFGVKADELTLIPNTEIVKDEAEIVPDVLITFQFPKSKFEGVIALMEGQAEVFKSQKMLLMLQSSLTEEGFKEMKDMVDYFLIEAKKVV